MIIHFKNTYLMPENIASIAQINLGFHQQEDRLLLKVGLADQSELSLWITRRICKDLWHLLQNSHGMLLSNPKPIIRSVAELTEILPTPIMLPKNGHKKPTVAALTHESSFQKSLEVMDFSTEYMTDRKALLEAPVLVVQCSIELTETQTSHLIFQAQAGAAIKMGLTLELVVALTNMMELATREAGWDLILLQNNATLNLTQTAQVLH